MIDFQIAYQTILSCFPQKKVEKIDLLKANGRVLYEPFYAKRDMPPFDRVAMDGIAVRSLDERKYNLIGVQYAGASPYVLQGKSDCIEVMTGAMIPHGTEAVIRYEDLVRQGDCFVLRENVKITRHQHIHLRGTDAITADLILSKNSRLNPASIALIAATGEREVLVDKLLDVSILSTGDELVHYSVKAKEHQIYSSNQEAILVAIGGNAQCFHAKDDIASICQAIEKSLENRDVLIISGGVSVGKKDLVPLALEKVGIEKIIHGVLQKPGKPFWFGRSRKGKLVFALPGNPIAMMVCLYLYVMPLFMGEQEKVAVLGENICLRPDIAHFILVKKIGSMVYPVLSSGSGDLIALGSSDGFILAGKGETVRFWTW